MTTIETVTGKQIKALRYESGLAGDAKMVETCTRALDGDDDALAACVRVIRAVEAM